MALIGSFPVLDGQTHVTLVVIDDAVTDFVLGPAQEHFSFTLHPIRYGRRVGLYFAL